MLAKEIEILNAVAAAAVPDGRRAPVREPCGSSTASSICAARRCRRTCVCATARRWRCASSSTAKASSTSRRRCSRARRPEGARDYLVPSRVHPGQFFALPQSPQLFKQLLMISGFDRYYQIVQVLPRRGSARRPPARIHADRHRDVVPRPGRDHRASWKSSCARCSRRCSTSSCRIRFRAWRYDEAMARYGSDKPDLRVPLELTELTDVDEGRRVQGVPRRRASRRAGASRRCACPAAARSRAARSTATPNS